MKRIEYLLVKMRSLQDDASHGDIDARDEADRLEKQIADEYHDLLAACEELVEDLIWAGGASDFAPEGIAHEGWIKAQATIQAGLTAIAKARGES